jgi:4-amino-4-deoxy-L-arabinose transferase-like glycosyltransferase
MSAAGRWATRLFAALALALLASQARMVLGHLVMACGGLDSAGYFGEARLLLTGHLTEFVPVAQVLPLDPATATSAAAPLGFVPSTAPFTIAPRFPPGFPLLIAAARAIAGASAPFFIPPLCAFAAVVCLALIVRARKGLVAAGLAAVLLASSPVFVDMALQPMSDAVAMFWTVLAAWLAWRSKQNAALAALAAGMGILTRPPLALAAGALLLVTPWASRRRAVVFAAIVGAFVSVLLLIQWHLYGGPFRSGYGTAEQLFTWASFLPNATYQLTWLVTIHTPLIVVLFAAGAWFDRGFAWRAGVMFLAVAFPYFVYAPRFEDWEILRFLLPGLPFVFGVCACGVAGAAGEARSLRPAIAAAIVALAATFWSYHAVTTRGVLDVREQERKYPLVGSWFGAQTSPRAVAIAALHSGSLRYYTGRPTLRMDALPAASLGPVISALQAGGYEPYLVLEQGDEFVEYLHRFQPDRIAGLTQDPLANIRGVYVIRLRSTP